MGGKKITNLDAPSLDSDVARKIDINDRLPLTGGKLSGDICMGNIFIHGLVEPVHDDDAATKKYVDQEAGNILFDTRAANNPPPPWDGTIPGTSGLYGVMSASGDQPHVYGTSLSPFIGFHMWSSDVNEWLNKSWPIIINPTRAKKIVSGYGLESPISVLQPLVHKLTGNIWGTAGVTFALVNADPLQPGHFSQDNMEIGSTGRINLEPAISIAASNSMITVHHLNITSAVKAVTLTHRSVQIEVLGAFKQGYFSVLGT